MPKSLPFDFRSRVLAAIDEGFSCRQAAARFGRRRPSQAARRRSAIAAHRAAWRSDPGCSCRGARHHPTGAEGAAGEVWRSVEGLRAVALLQAPQDHAQKKTAHASEQDRPDVLKRRQDWFESQLDLDPERLVFIHETWTSTKNLDLDEDGPHAWALRARGATAGERPARPLEDDDLRRRASHQRHRGAFRPRRSH